MTRPDQTERLSRLLPRLTEGEADRLSVGDILNRLQDRAHTVLLVVFALPNCLPAIPGTSAITGIPLVYLTLQLALGRKPWLPQVVMNRSLPRASLGAVLDKAQPWLERSERFLHPRLKALTGWRAERLLAFLMVIMAVAVVLPIPFGNMLPSLAIIFFCLGLMEEDGAWVIAGLVTVAVGVTVFSTVLWGLFLGALQIAAGLFGVTF